MTDFHQKLSNRKPRKSLTCKVLSEIGGGGSTLHFNYL